jgi:peptide/nickel transport system substrate-binding protein
MRRRTAALRIVLAAALSFAAAPVVAKTLRLNITADPSMIDPITYSELVSGRVLSQVYEGFTAETADGKFVPALAVSWTPLAGGDGFRFNLRPGVKFHSGRPFTAKDVKYTFEQLLTPGMKGGLGATYLGNVVGAADLKAGKTKELSGVTVVDDLTVEIRFTKVDVLFPIYPFQFMDSGVVAADGADWMMKVSAGTGPFKFKKWTRGVAVELEANKDYWGGAPKIDGVSFLVVPSADTALSQYDAGELDFLDVQDAIFRRVLRDDRYKTEIHKISRAQTRYIGMNQNLYAPFKDKRVREAVSLSINRDALIRGLYDGAAFPLNGVITPGVAGFNPDMPALKYDPERAKKLMAEAGFPDGKGLPPVDISATANYKDEMTYYANQLNRTLGMPVNVNIVERATFIKAMNAGEVAFFPWGWTADYPDGFNYLSQLWYSKSPYNRARWSNADYDKLIDEAQVTFDDAKRFGLYHKAEKILMDDWATAPLPMTAVIWLTKPNVTKAGMTPFGLDSFKDVEIK